MSREQALEAVQGAHGMLITCLHDLTSTVTAEELTLGLLIVCLDRCGFTELMDETCGVKIAVTTPYKVIVSMVRMVDKIYRFRYQELILQKMDES